MRQLSRSMVTAQINRVPVGIRSSAVMVAGNTFATSLSAIAVIIISRALGPEGFGQFSVGLALAFIYAQVVALGLSPTLVKFLPTFKTAQSQQSFISIIWWHKIIACVLTTSFLLMLAPWLSSWLDIKSGEMIIAIVALTTIVTVLYDQIASTAISYQFFVKAVTLNAIQAGTKILLGGLVLAAIVKTVSGSLALYLVAPATVLLVVPWLIPQALHFSVPTIDQLKSFWKTTRSFATHSWIAGMTSVLLQNIEVLLVTPVLTQFDTGVVGAVTKLSLFITMIGTSLAGVMYARASRYQNQADIRAFWWKGVWFMLGTLGVALLFTVLVSPLLLLTLGGQYASGIPMATMLITAAWISVSYVPLSALFYTFNKPAYFSISAGLQLVLIIVGNLVLLPVIGAFSIGLLRLAANMLLLVMTIAWGVQLYHHQFHVFPWSRSPIEQK